MASPDYSSGLFRRRLKREMEDWTAEHIITAEQAETLSARYDLNAPDEDASGSFVHTIYTAGATLIGLGVISFVAAHWAGLPVGLKLFLVIGVMLVCHGLGYYWWKQTGTRVRLGHALVLLGTLIFGANIGLIAQIFHIETDAAYQAYGYWAIGALGMAYAVQSIPHFLLALVTSFAWYVGWLDDHSHALNLYPFLLAGALLPVALRERAVGLFSATLLAFAVAVLMGAGFDGDQAWCITVAALCIGLLYYGWGRWADAQPNYRDFARPTMALGVLSIGIPLYLFTFHDVARRLGFEPPDGWWWLPVCLGMLVGAAYFWSRFYRPTGQPAALFNNAVLAGGIGTGLGMFLPPVLSTFAFNGLAFALAGAILWRGVQLKDRRIFWVGTAFVVLLIASRFFEYTTGLLIKSAAFVLCGVALILAGVRFENYLKQQEGRP